MKYNQILGAYGEEIAVKYLVKEGYKIVARNYRLAYGEIDIIASQGEAIVFCEVKTRTSLKYGTAAAAVDFVKRQHIIRVAQFFLNSGEWENYCPRFDIVEIYYSNNWHINHMVNAYVIDE